ncbi:hypothetical protein AB6G21_11340 [Providencia hangzhouensis]|uniref:hypothetical protein n=1 Tax=Providencia hangzhouensis TaxID=3031799 RepID=UPI0034DCD9A4
MNGLARIASWSAAVKVVVLTVSKVTILSVSDPEIAQAPDVISPLNVTLPPLTVNAGRGLFLQQMLNYK